MAGPLKRRTGDRTRSELEMAELETRRDELIRRLARGLDVIGDAQEHGTDDPKLHEHFERLLREYVQVEEEIQRRAGWDGYVALVGRLAA